MNYASVVRILSVLMLVLAASTVPAILTGLAFHEYSQVFAFVAMVVGIVVMASSILFLTPRPDWAAWFGAAGVAGVPPTGPRFSQADHAIDAALSGAGVILGRASLAAWALSSGVLIAPYELALTTEAHYRLLTRPGAEDRPGVRAFIDWIVELRARLGIPAGLKSLGVKPEHLDDLVAVALADGCHPSNPRVCTEADFKAIFERKMEEHREFLARFQRDGDEVRLGVDFGKKHGALEAIHKSVEEGRAEMAVLEEPKRQNMRPPLPQELDGIDLEEYPQKPGRGAPPPAAPPPPNEDAPEAGLGSDEPDDELAADDAADDVGEGIPVVALPEGAVEAAQ